MEEETGDTWPGQEWPGTEQTDTTPVSQAASQDEWPGEEWPGTEQTQQPRAQADTLVGANAREFAHGLVPMATGMLGAGAAGALGGSLAGPVGTVVGGIGGMMLGAYVGDKAQDEVLKSAGVDDDVTRALNQEKYGLGTLPGQLAPFVGSPVLAAEKGAGLLGQVTGNALKQRALGAGMMGGFDAVQQGFQGDIDPAHVLASAAFGAVSPNGNMATRYLHNLGAKGFTPAPTDTTPAPATPDFGTVKTAEEALGTPPGRPDLGAPTKVVDTADAFRANQSPSVAGNNALAQQPAPDPVITNPDSQISGTKVKAGGAENYSKNRATQPETASETGFSAGPATSDATLMSAIPREEPPARGQVIDAGFPEPPPGRVNAEDQYGRYTQPAEPEYTPQQQAERLAAIEARKTPAPVEAPAPEVQPPAAEPAPLPKEHAALVDRLRVRDMNDLADKFEAAAPEERQRLLPQILKALPRARVTEKTNLKNKLGQEANTPAKRDVQNRAIDAVQKAYDEHAPPESETADQLVTRLQAAVDTAHTAHGSNPLAKNSGYRPLSLDEHPTFNWFNKVQNAAGKARDYWTPKKIAEFKADETLAREGGTKSTDAMDNGIALSRRSGDEVVERASAKRAVNPEDELVAALDAKKAGMTPEQAEEALSKGKPFDFLTHEDETDATPRVTPVTDRASLAGVEPKGRALDATKPEGKTKLAKVLEKGKKRPVTPEEAGVKITKGSEISAERRAQLLKDSAASQAKAISRAAPEALPPLPRKSVLRDMTGAVVRFGKEESGSLNVGKILDDLKDWGASASKKAPYYVSSSRAKSLPGAAPGKPYPQPAADMRPRNAASISDRLHSSIQQDKIDKSQWLKFVDALKKASGRKNNNHGFLNDVTQRELYLGHEKGQIDKIPDDEVKKFYNETGKPIMEENGALYAAIQHMAPGKLGREVLNHIYRIAKGSNFRDEGGGAYDPVAGTNPMSTRARDTAIERTFVSLTRNSDGKRYVLALPKDGEESHSATVWENCKGTWFKDPDFKFKDGGDYKVGNETYKMGDALTEEIERHALNEKGLPMEYRKNFLESAIRANVYLRGLARHLQALHDIRESTEFKAYSTTDSAEAKEKGWLQSKTTLPGFEGHYMDPQIREVLDDFQQPGFNEESLNKLRNVSRAITKTIFWLPTAHALNVAAHWFVGRGWDWITPQGMRSLAQDGSKAIKMTLNQDPFLRRLAENGYGGVYSGILGQDFGPNLARKLGEQIERQPGRFGPVADALDMTVGDLARGIYGASSKAMWSANDMFLTQSILENLRKMGVDEKTATNPQIQQAIKRAERHIPNYRTPSRIISSGEWGRTLSKALADPLFFAFGRYHIGVYNSFAHLVKDITAGNGAERFEAVGHLMAMGALAYFVKPAIDKLWQVITGNEDAEARARGPLGPVSQIQKVRQTGDVSPLIHSTMTMSPLGSVVAAVLGPFTGFGGSPIIDPGTMKSAMSGDIKSAGKATAQATGYAAGSLVAPVGTLNNALGADRSLAGSLRDQVFDIHNPSDRETAYLGKVDRYNQQKTKQRDKRAPTILEKAFQ